MTLEQDDLLNLRFESFTQAQNGLFFDMEKRITKAVENQIKVTVNGKIDDIKGHLEDQDQTLKEMKEIIEVKNGFKQIGKLIMWIAGVVGAIIGLIKLIKW